MLGGWFPASELVPYVIARVLGGIAGVAVLYVIASGTFGPNPGFETAGFASNGFGEHSTGGYKLTSALWRDTPCDNMPHAATRRSLYNAPDFQSHFGNASCTITVSTC